MKRATAVLGILMIGALAGQAVAAAASRLSESTLVIIDAQREYRDGKMPLEGIDAALAEISRALAAARAAGSPVVHVRHHSKPGHPTFDPQGPYVQVVPEAAPAEGEPLVTKRFPDSFKGTDLDQVLRRLGRDRLILVGFMTQQCVAATTESARSRGYEVTLIASATAARQMPNPTGGSIPAAQVQARALERLSKIAAVVPNLEGVTA